MAWIYIIIAAVFETAWTFSVKFFKLSDLKLLTWHNFYRVDISFPLLAPLLGYILFGVGNVYFFSLSIKELSTATAYAIWTAATLVLIKIAEISFFNKTITWTEAFFISLIMIGIMGLKFSVTLINQIP
ncbi:MAG TPA: SMR family transporter [Mucilaginibacter sp.]|nr:SMR family transporter [Mucilaginibacter sp.]